jgi:tRNA threonylcarbamoyladenosine biosynthesis protein TsaB
MGGERGGGLDPVVGGVVLALETSGGLGGVAVGRGEELLAEVLVGVAVRHAESLLPAIDRALAASGLGPEALSAVVVGGGPGSFTGVRIAAATAKGLCRALDLPLFAYSGLAAVAAGAAQVDRPVCALFDARRGEVYAACYRFPDWERLETLLEPGAWSVEEVLAAVGRQPLYAGDGALRHAAALRQAGCRIAPPHLCVPRPAALLWLHRLDAVAGRVPDPGTWEPAYLRGSAAERGVPG